MVSSEAGIHEGDENPLLQDRFFADRDNARSPAVAVIDENLVRKYFLNQDAIGKRVNLDDINRQVEVVGAVGHLKQWGLDENAKSPVKIQIYTPEVQLPDKFMLGTAHVFARWVVQRSRFNAAAFPFSFSK